MFSLQEFLAREFPTSQKRALVKEIEIYCDHCVPLGGNKFNETTGTFVGGTLTPEDLTLTDFANLEKLTVIDTKLTNLTITLPKLKFLNCSYNQQLSCLTLNCPQLETWWLESNIKLYELNFAKMPNLIAFFSRLSFRQQKFATLFASQIDQLTRQAHSQKVQAKQEKRTARERERERAKSPSSPKNIEWMKVFKRTNYPTNILTYDNQRTSAPTVK